MGRGGPNLGKRADKILREETAPPAEPIGTTGRATGVVKWWDARRGYGAIATSKTEPWDIWCGFSHIEATTGYRVLTEGQLVEGDYFRVDQESFKYAATRVRPLTHDE